MNKEPDSLELLMECKEKVEALLNEYNCFIEISVDQYETNLEMYRPSNKKGYKYDLVNINELLL